jgi:hypothetical protein
MGSYAREPFFSKQHPPLLESHQAHLMGTHLMGTHLACEQELYFLLNYFCMAWVVSSVPALCWKTTSDPHMKRDISLPFGLYFFKPQFHCKAKNGMTGIPKDFSLRTKSYFGYAIWGIR